MPLSRVSTTKLVWEPDDRMAFKLTKPWKWPYITRLDGFLNRNPPTISVRQAFKGKDYDIGNLSCGVGFHCRPRTISKRIVRTFMDTTWIWRECRWKGRG